MGRSVAGICDNGEGAPPEWRLMIRGYAGRVLDVDLAARTFAFGPLDEDDTHRVLPGIVAGVGGYGNCLGLPNIGGEAVFDVDKSDLKAESLPALERQAQVLKEFFAGIDPAGPTAGPATRPERS